MDATVPPFDFDYRPGRIRFGRGCVSGLEDGLERLGAERALVVCGSNVGANPDVMDPLLEGIGDRLAGVFDRTTPAKHVDTARAGRDRMDDLDADAIVGVGGGSSLDVAKATAILRATDRGFDDLRAELEETGRFEVPEDPLVPLVAVPTTMAGADLSIGGSVALYGGEAPEGKPVNAGFSDRRLMPDALFYDPDLFETTPAGPLRSSAMNGFDKGVEAIYSRNATAITDATAKHGLGLLRDGLPGMLDDSDAMDRAVAGIVLVQYGLSTPGAKKLSVVHAFGHGLSRRYDVQQGTAHGIVAPHVLRFLFDRVDGRRRAIADGLGVDAGDPAEGVVDAVTEVRDALGLPDRLRTVSGLERDDLAEVARATVEDPVMANGPEGFDPDADEVEAVLRGAW